MRPTVCSEKKAYYVLHIYCILLIVFAMKNLTVFLVENGMRFTLKFMMTRVVYVRFDTLDVDQERANWGL
jgi:hypothetical protein